MAWKKYFESLLNGNQEVEDEQDTEGGMVDKLLWNEIENAFKSMKRGKSPGPG